MTLPNQCRGDNQNGMAEPGSGHVEDARSLTDGTDRDTEAIERASHEVEREGTATKEMTGIRPSGELRRTASNVLSQVASRMTTRSLPEPTPPPDGGVKAWTQVAMAWLVMVADVNSFGSFQTYYTTTMSQPPSTISWIGSLQTYLTLLIGAFSGRLLDAGLFVPTFLVGSVLQVLGMFLMSISTGYWHLMLTQGVLTGIGGGLFFTPSLALIASFGTQALGLSYSSASILIIVLNGVALPFRVIPALIADRIGVLNVIVPLIYAWCIVAFCWLAVTNTTGYYIFTCFYGIVSVAFSIASFASLTGPPIGGALQGANGGKFVAPQAWAAGMTAIAMVLITLARVFRGGYNLKIKC
ncbi:hypothetical protein DL766_002343 [Monosporascus sp. MC13-8B]|uniref:Major facilitator superfamily (MFS) profile domain-containing protein n=1 Tax=Monosporascus cannonballus TaxID=155416 RepID=A0ABY0H2D7_9PEZI|nr:hypothetical protein DL762_006464 [Monosporascus cannonballus]RYO86612.1 hypothetical protein DL763_006633 [Monosporascus cannonballus]RYP35783.1 hypothetical protein DL766_002343 [Monosporascus sp. MC13-8B]